MVRKIATKNTITKIVDKRRLNPRRKRGAACEVTFFRDGSSIKLFRTQLTETLKVLRLYLTVARNQQLSQAFKLVYVKRSQSRPQCVPVDAEPIGSLRSVSASDTERFHN